MRSSEFITEHFLLEGATDVLYHYTRIYPALKILSNGKFELSSVVGNKSEEDYAPQGYPYFLSTTRSRVGDYHRYVGDSAVMFVLDGRWFQQRYLVQPVDYWASKSQDPITGKVIQNRSMWIGDPVRTRESEDRVFSKDATIPIQGVRAIHILMKEQHETRSAEARKILIMAKKQGIPAYLYTNETAWRLQDTRRAVGASEAKHVLKGPEPSRRSYGKKYLSKWLELMYKKSVKELTPEADKLRYNLQYYSSEGLHNLDNDMSNARKPDAADHDQAIKIVKYMRNNKLNKLQDLIEALKSKWKQITDTEKKV